MKLGGQEDAKPSQSYQYLLVKSISLFDLLTVMMVPIAPSMYPLVRWASHHSNLAKISTLVRLRVYSPMPALRIGVQPLP